MQLANKDLNSSVIWTCIFTKGLAELEIGRRTDADSTTIEIVKNIEASIDETCCRLIRNKNHLIPDTKIQDQTML